MVWAIKPNLCPVGFPAPTDGAFFIRPSIMKIRERGMSEERACGTFSTINKTYSFEVCNPHSVFAVPVQRPARSSSSDETARVQGRQPMLAYPWSCNGL